MFTNYACQMSYFLILFKNMFLLIYMYIYLFNLYLFNSGKIYQDYRDKIIKIDKILLYMYLS